jgi:hypothetical protein
MRSVRKYVILCLGIALAISLVLRPSFVFGTETPLGESAMMPPSTPTTTPPSSSTEGPTNMPPLPTVTESRDGGGDTILATEDKGEPPVRIETKETKERNCVSFKSLSDEEKKDCRDFVVGYIVGIRLAFGIAQGVAKNVTADQKFPAAKIIAQIPAAVERLALGEYTHAYRVGVFLGLQKGADIVELFGVAEVDTK